MQSTNIQQSNSEPEFGRGRKESRVRKAMDEKCQKERLKKRLEEGGC